MQPQGGEVGSVVVSAPVVLDTNAVLALYWFRDPRVQPLAQALQAGRLKWLATTAMRQELLLVLQRAGGRTGVHSKGRLAGGICAVQEALQMFDRLSIVQEAVAGAAAARCTDADDQKFIDLALACKAAWLFSRDRAVLRLRHKLQALGGCRVLRPEDWDGSVR